MYFGPYSERFSAYFDGPLVEHLNQGPCLTCEGRKRQQHRYYRIPQNQHDGKESE